MTYQLKERIWRNPSHWKSLVYELSRNIDMHHNTKGCFSVIYIPFYALQSARQKRVLEEFARKGKRLDQLSFEGIKSDISGIDKQCKTDDVSANLPAALLSPDGMHVLELN